MDSSTEENPFASPHSAQAPRRDAPTEIEATSPIDVRGYCYACGAAGEQDFQQDFYSGRLLVDYSLCQNCFWRRRWQRWSLMVNAALVPTMGVMTLVLLGMGVAFALQLPENPAFNQSAVLGILVLTSLFISAALVLANIILRIFAVFHWYPTKLRHGVYRLTALHRNFAENYFQQAEAEE